MTQFMVTGLESIALQCWLPTPVLRYARRLVPSTNGFEDDKVMTTSVVLQQQWFDQGSGKIEWRDIPVVDEPSAEGG